MRVPRALVAMECMGNTRNALRAVGVDAWSCDLLPDVNDSPFHIQGDAFDVLRSQPYGYYDLGIAHPTCTYLTCSAEWAYKEPPYHQKVKPGTLVGGARRLARKNAEYDFQQLWIQMTWRCKRFAIENPVGVMSRWKKPDQTIQPYQFGADASKRTCLWLKNLPLLIPTNRVQGRIVNGVERWANQTDSGQNRLPPTSDRWLARAETYPGISAAIADQWGKLLFEEGFELT